MTTTDYVTEEELRDHLRIEDQDDGPRLSAVINAVSRAIDTHCGQFFYDAGSASARTYQPVHGGLVITHPFHTTTGLVVATGTGDGSYATSWTITTDYVLRPTGGYNAAGMTVPYREIVAVGSKTFPCDVAPTVQVTARWGWAAVPDAVREACLIKCARVFRRRDTPEGVMGGIEFGQIRVSSREDPDAAMLLAPYVNPHGSPVVFG